MFYAWANSYIVKKTAISRALATCQSVRELTEKGSPLATRAKLHAICGSSCASHVGMTKWEICGLADGRILGSDYGGGIETIDVSAVVLSPDCWIVCTGAMLSST